MEYASPAGYDVTKVRWIWIWTAVQMPSALHHALLPHGVLLAHVTVGFCIDASTHVQIRLKLQRSITIGFKSHIRLP